MKLGSLFDGSGTCPLAASAVGITPAWASEVEPYPVAVTRSRFPNMTHLGSVTDIHGRDIEPVDIITFGSPCQDLSVAGKRAGLKHEANGDEETTRSGLFMEAVRIIKEMRDATNGEYPTFAVWENVPGAFSSNKGEDFRTVLEELIKIVEPTAVMPAVPKNGWAYADSYIGDRWSLAYRVLDAQYWGVPQRRRRIYLVLDLRGQRAREVLFEREGLRRDFTKSGTPWQGTAGEAANRSGTDDCEGEGNCLTPWDVQSRRIFSVDGPWPALYGGEGGGHGYACVPYPLKIRSGCEGGGKGALIQEDKSTTLATNNDQYLFQPVNMVLDDRGGQQITVRTDGKAPTLRAETHGNLPAVMEPVTIEPGIAAREGGHIYEGVSGTLRANAGDNQMAVAYAAGFKAGQGAKARSIGWEDEKCVAYSFDSLASNSMKSKNPHSGCRRVEIAKTLDTTDPNPSKNQGGIAIVCVKCYDARGNGDGQTVSTLTGDHEDSITDYTSVICMAHGQANAEILEDKSPCLNCNHEQPIVFDKEVYNSGVNATGGHYIAEGGPAPTLRTSVPPGVCVQYIVRRLTPTECARLQGFPDDWGHPDHKEDFTDEEYRFWLNVRNTHAAINGKPQKDYTKAQMLTWYNKLHTDSSEYKMWGNGMAFPCMLYIMEGVQEVLAERYLQNLFGGDTSDR